MNKMLACVCVGGGGGGGLMNTTMLPCVCVCGGGGKVGLNASESHPLIIPPAFMPRGI